TPEGRGLGRRCHRHWPMYSATNLVAQCGEPRVAGPVVARLLPGRARRTSAGRAPGLWGEAERESAHAGRRGLGASEGRRARSARALDGPPDMGRPSARALMLADGVWGHRKGAGRAAPEHWRGPRYGEAER